MLLSGQITETEPNNNCDDGGVITITENGTYQGIPSGSQDHEYWKIKFGSSGSANFTATKKTGWSSWDFVVIESADGFCDWSGAQYDFGDSQQTVVLQSDKYYTVYVRGQGTDEGGDKVYQFTITGYAFTDAIHETEPNNSCDDSGVITITKNATYQGVPSSSVDHDYWKINFGSSGNATFNATLKSGWTSWEFIVVESADGFCDWDGTQYDFKDSQQTISLQSDKYYTVYIRGQGSANGDDKVYRFTITGDASLPVELSSFSAHVTDQGVQLQWVTESEVDNLGFIIERQENSQEGWQQIASFETHNALKGQGNKSFRTEYAFTDINVVYGSTYTYRLSDVDLVGAVTIKDVISILYDVELSTETVLEPVFPNPFNPVTKIAYKLSEDAQVTLKVMDITGRLVKYILKSQLQKAGSYSYFWNGKDDKERLQPSGAYLLLLNAGVETKVQKVILLR